MYIGEVQKQIVQGSGVIVSKLRSAKVVKNGCHPMSQWGPVGGRPRRKCLQTKKSHIQADKGFGTKI